MSEPQEDIVARWHAITAKLQSIKANPIQSECEHPWSQVQRGGNGSAFWWNCKVCKSRVRTCKRDEEIDFLVQDLRKGNATRPARTQRRETGHTVTVSEALLRALIKEVQDIRRQMDLMSDQIKTLNNEKNSKDQALDVVEVKIIHTARQIAVTD